MQPKWHIAFCNVTFTEYADVTYRDYYSSPQIMLETQLAAKEFAQCQFGVGRFISPVIDIPACTFAALLGMPVINPLEDEIPYLDTSKPLITEVADVDQLNWDLPDCDDYKNRFESFWRYFNKHGFNVGIGGAEGSVISTAVEITGGGIFVGLVENPAQACQVLDYVVNANEKIAGFGVEITGQSYNGFSYTGDDFSGLLSPKMYREFAIPCYQKLYGVNQYRFMHSELLSVEHLQIARDELGISEFHGAGCKNLTLQEMQKIMGEKFWTQITPQELLEWTPAQLEERIKEYANCGCEWVQLYPGRGTPLKNMEHAIKVCQRECPG